MFSETDVDVWIRGPVDSVRAAAQTSDGGLGLHLKRSADVLTVIVLRGGFWPKCSALGTERSDLTLVHAWGGNKCPVSVLEPTAITLLFSFRDSVWIPFYDFDFWPCRDQWINQWEILTFRKQSPAQNSPVNIWDTLPIEKCAFRENLFKDNVFVFGFFFCHLSQIDLSSVLIILNCLYVCMYSLSTCTTRK